MDNKPLYQNIYDDIVRRIKGHVLVENAPLPSERKMCEHYHVSRTTVRRALEQLEYEKYIFKKHGSGNFVKPRVFEQPLAKFYSFTDTLKEDGVVIKNLIIDYALIEADSTLADVTGYDEGERFHRLTRLRSAHTYPLMIETTYLPKIRFFRLDVELLSDQSLYEYLNRHYNMRVDRSIEKLCPVNANSNERKLLNIPTNLPCMAVERFNYEDGELIEYTQSVIRGDKYKFRAELAIPG